MRILTTILLLFCFKANATIYYVSNAGNDSNNGTSTSTTWRTIAKINSVTLSPGDQVLFKAGDSWNEQLNPPNSGSAGNEIIFDSYGTGAKPVITGLQTLTGGINVGNVWSFTFSNSVRYQNTVLVNGTIAAKGRYPNYGWLTFTSHSGNDQITGALTGTPNYTGGEVVVRSNHYTIDRSYITSQSTGTINFSPATYYSLVDGFGYFIQNIPSVLDTLNEWCYDTTTKIIKVYAAVLPTVKASSIDTLVNLVGKSYLTFDGIYFEGANLTVFELSASHHITITNCDLINQGENGITGKLSNYMAASNCTFSNIWNDAIKMIDMSTALADSDSATVYNNYISNIGTKAGMGKTGFMTYTAITLFGDHPLITNNVMIKSGYQGVYFYGDSAIVKNNFVDTFCFVKDEGAGIYTFMYGGAKVGGLIRSNIVLNGLNASLGTVDMITNTSGISTDDSSTYVIIDSNTVANCTTFGIFLHKSRNITTNNNTIVGSTLQFGIQAADYYDAHMGFSNNILYNNGLRLVLAGSPQYFSTMDYNRYYNKSDSTKIIQGTTPIYGIMSLKQWQDSTIFDTHSSLAPSGITSAEPILKYNTTSEVIAYGLSGTYYDMIGGIYVNTVVVQPFQSVLLFKATTDIVIPNNGILKNVRVSKATQL